MQTEAEKNQIEEQAMEELRATLQKLYGKEETLIVLNETNTVVSIGFGERGDLGGYPIPRSNLPIVLTDLYAAETWLKSSDFRRALTKRWLRVIDRKTADMMTDKARLRELAIKKAVGGQTGREPMDATINRVDPENQPMIIDEETASLKSVAQDPMYQKFAEYEDKYPANEYTPPANAPSTAVVSDDVSSRAVAVVDQLNRGSIQPMDALTQIDEDEPLLTVKDLQYIRQKVQVAVPSVAGFVAELIEKKQSRE